MYQSRIEITRVVNSYSIWSRLSRDHSLLLYSHCFSLTCNSAWDVIEFNDIKLMPFLRKTSQLNIKRSISINGEIRVCDKMRFSEILRKFFSKHQHVCQTVWQITELDREARIYLNHSDHSFDVYLNRKLKKKNKYDQLYFVIYWIHLVYLASLLRNGIISTPIAC